MTHCLNPSRIPSLAGSLLLGLAAAGCASAPAREAPPPVSAQATAAVETAGNGAIYAAPGYQSQGAMTLFNDLKAHRVGDMLTVRLAERTQASKSNSTDTSKESSLSTGLPTLLGGGVTRNGEPILSNEFETKQDFAGKGSSSQSNQLTGSLTVTVTAIHPNGNLQVRGEKWLMLNQGEELIQVEGVVRPADIGADNSVSSLKIADARISYRGKGALADSNSHGLLARLFLKFWPL
jgi:flagellar L-ring protein FlgH